MKTDNLVVVLLVAIVLVSCSPTPVSLPAINPSLTLENTSVPVSTATPIPQPEWVYLSDMQPNLAQVGFWSYAIGKYPASEGSMVEGQVIHNDDKTYPHGLFVSAPSNVRYELNGDYQSFKSEIFIDPSMICATDGALFQVYLDSEMIYSEHVAAPTSSDSNMPKLVNLDIHGGKILLLHTDPGENADMACDATIWGEPALLTDPMPAPAIPANAPLEQQPELARELKRFTNAMRAAGAIEADRSISFSDVQVANFKDLNGETFEAAFVHLDPDPAQGGEAFERDYPLLVNEDGQWKKVGLRFWAEANKMGIALPLIANDSELDDPTYSLKLLSDNATQIVLYVDISPDHLFSDFKSKDWQQVVDNWELVNQQLDQGILPDGFTYHWEGADRVLALADELNMDVRIGEILPTASAVPEEIIEGQFNHDQLENLFEFMLKVPMIKYRDRVKTWLVVTEATGWLSSGSGPEKSWGFPFLQLGGVDIMERAYGWAHETSPDATLILTDDHILLNKMVSDFGSTQPHWNNVFFKTVTELKDRNAPIDAIDIENNFWIYNPPDMEFMRSQLQHVQELGYSIYAPEVTVLTSEEFPWTSMQSQKEVQVSNPVAAQALIYQQTLQVYLDLGIQWFGLGGISDRFSFWRYSEFPETHAMILDYNQQPKAAYYLLVSTFYAHLKDR
jgi:GH35 family endo-1,4-beta-xylanase